MSRTGQQQYIHQSEAAPRIRDESGVDSSVFQYQDHMSESIRTFVPVLVLSSQPGKFGWIRFGALLRWRTSWNAMKGYRKGRDFENGEFYSSAVVFSSTGVNFQLTSRGRIRFRCNASIDTDWVYIDEVLVLM
jgi:hypothetical protein